MAAPDREVFAMVGDGSYLMMAQEIVTAVSEGIKLVIVLVQNQGFASIGALSESLGSQRFGTRYRYRNPATGMLDGDVLPVDLAANAAEPRAPTCCGPAPSTSSRPPCARRGPPIAPPSSTSRPTRWRPCPRRRAGGTCRSSEVAALDSTRAARAAYEAQKAEQRPYL